MKNKYFYFDKYFYLSFVFLIILSFIIGVGLEDYDGLLTRSNLSMHENIIRLFNPFPILLLIFNISILSLILSYFYKINKLLFLFTITNPFIIVNTFDAYNKFIFITFFLYISYVLIEKNYKYFFLLFPAVLSIHPFYIFSLFSIREINKKLLAISLVAFVVAYMVYEIFSIQDMLEDNAKYQLIMKYAFDLASLYDGNMALKEMYKTSDLDSTLIRFIAMSFPYSFVVKENFMILLLSIYQLTFLFYTTIILTKDRLAVLILTYLIIAILVGNFAVFNRHFLPLLLFLFIVELINKNKIKNINTRKL